MYGCGRTGCRGEKLDDQAEIFILEDRFRGQRVRIALRKDGLPDTGKCI